MQKTYRVKIEQVLEALKLSFGSELNETHSEMIVEKLLKRKFIIEPDNLYFKAPYRLNEIVYLGKTDNASFLSGDSYKLASLMLDFGVGFAYLDNIFCVNEKTSLYDFISKNFLKNETEKEHLKLRIRWLRKHPPDLDKMTVLLTKRLGLNDLKMFSEYIMMVVLADGKICEKEDKKLRSIFETLGLNDTYVKQLYKKFDENEMNEALTNMMNITSDKESNNLTTQSSFPTNNNKNNNLYSVKLDTNSKNEESIAITDDNLNNKELKNSIYEIQNTVEKTNTIFTKSREEKLNPRNDLKREILLEKDNGSCEVSRIEVDTKRTRIMLSKCFEHSQINDTNYMDNNIPVKLDENHRKFVVYVLQNRNLDKIDQIKLENKARELRLMPNATITQINEWSDENYGDLILSDDEEEKIYQINQKVCNLIEKEKWFIALS